MPKLQPATELMVLKPPCVPFKTTTEGHVHFSYYKLYGSGNMPDDKQSPTFSRSQECVDRPSDPVTGRICAH